MARRNGFTAARNPVDGEPLSWNAQTGELAVNHRGEHPRDQPFSVTLQ
jgi:hypothetical protein